jgi:hypothetical protein
MLSYGPFDLRRHVILDYSFIVLGLAAPWLFGYSEHMGATLYTLALTIFGLGMNAVTNYAGGLWKVLPFQWHRYVELAAPPPFIIVPWLFFAEAGAMPWFLSALGVAIPLNAALTRPIDSSAAASAGGGRSAAKPTRNSPTDQENSR